MKKIYIIVLIAIIAATAIFFTLQLPKSENENIGTNAISNETPQTYDTE